MKKTIIKTTIALLALYIMLFLNNNVYADSLELGVGDGYDIKSHITDCDEYISFSSLDSTIISVDSNGYVTGIKPGNTSIKVSYIDTNGVSKETFIGFNIILRDGYYRIRNIETNKYLSASNIKTKYDPSVFLTEQYLSGNEELCQIWQVVKTTSNKRYLIKPYFDESAILCHNQVFDDIRIEKIPTYNADYCDEFLNSGNRNWSILGNKIYTATGGYNYAKKLSRYAFSDSTITTDTWLFEKVENAPSGIRLIDEYYNGDIVNERFMAVDSENSLDDLKIRCLRYSECELVAPVWSSSNTNVVSVDAITGKVTANSTGSAVISVTQPGMLMNNSYSYTIRVLPLKDGIYTITNKLGSQQLEVAQQNGVNYLKRSTSSATDSLWYIQTTISGEYFISVVDNKSIGSYYVLGAEDIADENGTSTYATLGVLANNSSYVPTWNIRSNELGYSIELESEASSSMFVLDANDSKVKLGEIDYEDYEGMWNVSKVVETNKTNKLYIHPYYDSEFVSLFSNHTDAIDSINSYLEYVETVLESEFEVQVEVYAASEMSTTGISDLNNKNEYRSELSKLFASSEVSNPYYRYTHKYIIYSGHNFTSGNTSGNVDDIPLIAAYGSVSDIESMKFDSLHEISHTLGARDHYHTGDACNYGGRCTTCGTFELKRPEHCILHYYTYDKENPYCNECKMEIIAGINTKCVE